MIEMSLNLQFHLFWNLCTSIPLRHGEPQKETLLIHIVQAAECWFCGNNISGTPRHVYHKQPFISCAPAHFSYLYFFCVSATRHFSVTFPSPDILNPNVFSMIVLCFGMYSSLPPAAQFPATAAIALAVE